MKVDSNTFSFFFGHIYCIVSIFSCEGGCNDVLFIERVRGGGRDNALFDLFRVFLGGRGGGWCFIVVVLFSSLLLVSMYTRRAFNWFHY